jgi:hypothetical protein
MTTVTDATLNSQDGIAYLRRLLRYTTNPQFAQMVNDRDSVYAQYGHLFSPARLDRLTAEDFKEFLLYDNNRHWWGIHRHQTKLVADMGRLKSVLGRILDESLAIEDRLDWVEPRTPPKPLPGLGKAVITPIVHVVYPDKYGVWNSIAEDAMNRLGVWPPFGSSWGFGKQYQAVNDQILMVAAELGVDLWTIDSLWWPCELEHAPEKHQFEGVGPSAGERTTSTRARHTFTCSECFQAKSEHLRAVGTSRCVDCAK